MVTYHHDVHQPGHPQPGHPSAAAAPDRRLDLLFAALLVVMWSSGFIGAELGTRFAPADTLLAWRYVAAAVLVTTWAALRGVRPDRHTWPRLVLVGLLCQCLYLGGVVTGVGLGVPPGTAALVAALQPLLVAVVAAPLLGERTTVVQRVGLGLGVVGVALVVASDLGAGHVGVAPYALVVGGMLALSAGTLLERRLRLPVTLLESLTVQTLTAAAFFLSVATLDAPPAAAGRPAVLGGGAVGGGAVHVRRLRQLPGGAAAQRRDPGEHAAVPDPADHGAVGVPDVRHGAGAARAARCRGLRARGHPRRTADPGTVARLTPPSTNSSAIAPAAAGHPSAW